MEPGRPAEASRAPPPGRGRASAAVAWGFAPAERAIDVGSPLAEILAGLLAYLIGGVPFGWLAVRIAKGQDLRRIGSGNIGATNASRLWPGTVSIMVFVIVFALDFAKGFAAVSFAHRLGHWLGSDPPGETLGLICGASAILGHVFTPYLHFRGGKGVATAFGVVTALAPWSSLAALGIWGILVAATRYMSLGSIGAMLAIPITYYASHGGETFRSRLASFVFFVLLAAMVVWRHRENILRILSGSERKVGTTDQI